MSKTIYILTVISLFLTLVNPTIAQVKKPKGLKGELVDVYVHYKQGNYQKAVRELDSIINKRSNRKKTKLISTAHYWKGLSYNRLQDFDKATESFRKAIKLKNNSKDLYYEYGQALYATNSLDAAMKAFAMSVKMRFEVATSLYYLGFISQTQSRFPLAIKFYRKIEELEDKYQKKEVLQGAMFQIGEIRYAEAKKHPKTNQQIKDVVFPKFREAIDVDDDSSLAKDIRVRMFEIQRKHEVDPFERFANGRKLPTSKYVALLTQSYDYDTNILNQADQVNNQATNKDTGIFNTSAYLSYRFVIAERFMIAPEFDAGYKKTSDQTEPNIFTNDQYSLTPGMKISWEHRLLNKPATLRFSYSYGLVERDYLKIHQYKFFSRTNTFGLSEIFQFTKLGNTTFKYSYAKFDSYTAASDSATHTILGSQVFLFKGGHYLLTSLSAAITTSDTTPTNEQNLYLLSNSLTTTPLWWKIQTTTTLNLSLTDTKLQEATRGWERTFNPSFTFFVQFTPLIRGDIAYAYTSKYSKDKQNYDYSKHVYTMAIKLAF